MPVHMVMAYTRGYQRRREMESSIVISLHRRTAASSSALYGLHAKCKRAELPRANHKRLSGRIGALDRVCGDLSRAMPECGQNLGLLPTLRRELGANNPNGQASAPHDRLGQRLSVMAVLITSEPSALATWPATRVSATVQFKKQVALSDLLLNALPHSEICFGAQGRR